MTSPALNIPPRSNVLNGMDRILSMPRASIARLSAASPGSGAIGIFAFDALEYDSDGMVDISANPSRLTCRTSGLYLCIVDIAWQGNTTGWRRSWVSRTTRAGVQTLFASDVRSDPTGIGVWNHSLAVVPLEAGDYVEAQYFQNSGGPLALQITPSTAAVEHINTLTAIFLSATP